MPAFQPGFELYSARGLLAQDFVGTLEVLSAIGYREIEGSDLFGHRPEEARRLFDRLSLSVPAWHVFLDPQNERALAEGARLCRTLGAGTLVIPAAKELIDFGEGGVTLRRDLDLATWQRIAADLNRAGARLASEGLRLAYHNHAVELIEVAPDRCALEVLLDETDPECVGFEIDLCWTVAGGGDPLALFEAHPGRFPLCHAKDTDARGVDLDVGTGIIDFDAVLTAAPTAGFEHVFVERDEEEAPRRTAERGFEHLAAWWREDEAY